MDSVQLDLPDDITQRTRLVWMDAVGKAKEKYGAACCGKDGNYDQMDPTYKAHKESSTRTLETTSGLVFLHAMLGDEDSLMKYQGTRRPHVYTDEGIETLKAWAPDWRGESEEEIAKQLKRAPMYLSGTRYKLMHVARTCKESLGYHVPAKDDMRGDFMGMSDEVVPVIKVMYPERAQESPQAAVAYIHEQSKVLVQELVEGEGQVSQVQQDRIDELELLSRGDEVCDRCEFKCMYPLLNDEHVSAMEWAVATGQGIGRRYAYDGWPGGVRDSEEDGLFFNGTVAADALVEVWREAGSPVVGEVDAVDAVAVTEYTDSDPLVIASGDARGGAYTGVVVGGYSHGKGVMRYDPHRDEVYDRQWANGKRHGHGTHTLSTGTTYVGQWEDDKRSGLGKRTLYNGIVHEGEWVDDKLHAEVIYTNL